jgi:hypothetical protein
MGLSCEANSVRLLCSGLVSLACAVNHFLFTRGRLHDITSESGRSGVR